MCTLQHILYHETDPNACHSRVKNIYIYTRQLCMWLSIHTTIFQEIFKEERFCEQPFKNICEFIFLLITTFLTKSMTEDGTLSQYNAL